MIAWWIVVFIFFLGGWLGRYSGQREIRNDLRKHFEENGVNAESIRELLRGLDLE